MEFGKASRRFIKLLLVIIIKIIIWYYQDDYEDNLCDGKDATFNIILSDFQDSKGAFKSTHLIVRLAAKGGGLEGGEGAEPKGGGGGVGKVGQGGGGGKGGELGGGVKLGGNPVQLRGGGELGRELRLRETFLAELSR